MIMLEERDDKKIDPIPGKSPEVAEANKESSPEKGKSASEIIAERTEAVERVFPMAMTEGEELEKMIDNSKVDKEDREDLDDKKDEVKDRIEKAKEKYAETAERLSGDEKNEVSEDRIKDKQNRLDEITREIDYINSSSNMSPQDKEERIKELHEEYEKIKNSHDVHTHVDDMLDKKNVEEALYDIKRNHRENTGKSQENRSANKIEAASRCPKCGGETFPGDKFCTSCGNKLVSGEQELEKQVKEEKNLGKDKTKEEIMKEVEKINAKIDNAPKSGLGLEEINEFKKQRERLLSSLDDFNDDFGTKIGEKDKPREPSSVFYAQNEEVKGSKINTGLDDDGKKANEKITRELKDKDSPLFKAKQQVEDIEYEIENIKDHLSELRIMKESDSVKKAVENSEARLISKNETLIELRKKVKEMIADKEEKKKTEEKKNDSEYTWR